ncbi:Ger(x)C family spore germination protein [Bacillus cereus]|uniref:Ger(x)C family spore germination protein n=1 Tax=Paenibacillus TaxID=44249 RepID=UPI0020BDCD39|nr:Ger(x)C family spore germination protein [Paenibacillus dendritiformis]MEB9894636.1 Ger(x)C family spore germination protein [Bacillus cereus]
MIHSAYIWRTVAIWLMVTLPLTGCWDRREVNDMVIAVAMGVDRAEEGYTVSAQVVDPAEIASKKGSGRAPVTVYKERGKTVFEAVRRMTTMSARKIYFSHLRMFLIGEEAARQGIGHAIEFISRDHEFRTDFYIAIARESRAEEILKDYPAIEKIPADKMFSSLEMSSKSWAATGTVKLDELISDLMTAGKTPVITGIRYLGDIEEGKTRKNVQATESPAQLKYDGMAVIRKDKLVGWLDEEESKGYNYIKGSVRSTVGVIPCPGEEGNLALENIRTSSRVHVNRGSRTPKINIHVKVIANIGETQCKGNLADPAVFRDVEKIGEERLAFILEKTLKKAHDVKTDFIGLGAALHRSAPGAWARLKSHWPERMDSVPVHFHVDVKLRLSGKTKGTFLEKVKE